MKRLLFIFALIVGPLRPAFADKGAITITGDTRSVTVSSTIASPTQLWSNDPFVVRTWVVNLGTSTVFVSSSAASVSTSSFGIPGTPANATPSQWTPDGTNVPFWGALFGASSGGTPTTLGIFRSK